MSLAGLQFALMCLTWGLTWIAAKTGIAAVPPLLFVGTRFLAAGFLLLALAALRGERLAPPRGAWPGLAASAGLAMGLSPALLFWGLQFIATGLSAVINLSLVPIGLYLLGLAHGVERKSRSLALGVGLGAAGLVLLFAPRIGDGAPAGLAGIAAVVVGTFAFCWGSVLAKPALALYGAIPMSAATSLAGGALLVLASLAFERPGTAALAAFADGPVLAGWAFLVVFGSILAYTIYLRLVRDWGVVRAGLYAFVSPVIAVAVGAIFFGERFAWPDLLAMASMLAATWIALRRPLDR